VKEEVEAAAAPMPRSSPYQQSIFLTRKHAQNAALIHFYNSEI
jgi:hypothetical protein